MTGTRRAYFDEQACSALPTYLQGSHWFRPGFQRMIRQSAALVIAVTESNNGDGIDRSKADPGLRFHSQTRRRDAFNNGFVALALLLTKQ